MASSSAAAALAFPATIRALLARTAAPVAARRALFAQLLAKHAPALVQVPPIGHQQLQSASADDAAIAAEASSVARAWCHCACEILLLATSATSSPSSSSQHANINSSTASGSHAQSFTLPPPPDAERSLVEYCAAALLGAVCNAPGGRALDEAARLFSPAFCAGLVPADLEVLTGQSHSGCELFFILECFSLPVVHEMLWAAV
jgi:hypothetical protein